MNGLLNLSYSSKSPPASTVSSFPNPAAAAAAVLAAATTGSSTTAINTNTTSINGVAPAPHTKCCERSYTTKDLEDGIEAVINQELTPAKAISKYRIPRRTFFRRLSAVRKSRGIPSAKESASDYYQKSYKKLNGKFCIYNVY